ncbi:MAG: DUF4203 domain-containing protein [Clostridiales bacterium]|nr:DUF4203 domain-containing protein [Clostridiales bacterium]
MNAIADLAVPIVIMILGAVICFSGYRLFRFSITVAGVVTGYMGGKFLLSILEEITEKSLAHVVELAIPIVFAVVLGALAFSFYRKAFIFVVAVVTTKFLYSSVNASSLSESFKAKENLIVLGISFVIGIAFGIACFLIQKGAIIFVSGMGGAWLISSAALPFLQKISFVENAAVFATEKLFNSSIDGVFAISGLLILILGITGIVVQTKRG